MQPATDPKPLIKFTLRQLFALMTAVAVVFGLIFYLASIHNATLRREGSKNNLRAIGLALAGYESCYGRFPPRYVADAQGKPLYSWRVLILNYLEETHLQKRWRMNEPWDSPHNRSLPVPWCFSCPGVARSGQLGASPYTDYLAVVGPGMAWEEGKRLALADLVDSMSSTISVVEVRGSQIHWAEPVDFDATTSLKFNAPQGLSIGSHDGDGANVLFVDCDVQRLPNTTSEQEIKALLTRAGGEGEPWRDDGWIGDHWFGELHWTGKSWEGICQCDDKELPFWIDVDVVDPTDEQRALALVAARKVDGESWNNTYFSHLALDAAWDEKTRLAAAKEVLEAAYDPADLAPTTEEVEQLSADMTLESLRMRYCVRDAVVLPYLVYRSPQRLPKKTIRVRFSTQATISPWDGEITKIKNIDEVTIIDE